MAYALIPDGYSLKKVTKLQKRAVDEKRRHDDVVALLSNENTPLVVGIGALVALTPILFAIFMKAAEEQGIALSDTQKSAILGAVPVAVGAENFEGALFGAGGVKVKNLFNTFFGDKKK